LSSRAGAANDPTRLTVTATGPVLAATQTVSDLNGGSLNPGDALEYTITITNSGFGDATSAVVGDPVPLQEEATEEMYPKRLHGRTVHR